MVRLTRTLYFLLGYLNRKQWQDAYKQSKSDSVTMPDTVQVEQIFEDVMSYYDMEMDLKGDKN